MTVGGLSAIIASRVRNHQYIARDSRLISLSTYAHALRARRHNTRAEHAHRLALMLAHHRSRTLIFSLSVTLEHNAHAATQARLVLAPCAST